MDFGIINNNKNKENELKLNNASSFPVYEITNGRHALCGYN